MPEQDIKDKNKLTPIAKKIIEDFDKKHKNSEFVYYDYMKIGEWVYKNIKYNLSYVGAPLTALEIYNKRTGVCSHFTRLSNVLLFSLGYKVLFATGFCAENNIFDDDVGHAWSLIKIGNIWFPFDSTWGLFKGKIPITHVFGNVNNTANYTCNYSYSYNISISYDKRTILGKYME